MKNMKWGYIQNINNIMDMFFILAKRKVQFEMTDEDINLPLIAKAARSYNVTAAFLTNRQ
jgi:hypothetical protein